MRKIVAGLFISLDGVVEEPGEWHFPYFSDDMGEVVDSQMAASDTMLLGRRTYQDFADYWPNQTSDEEPADYMNGVQKVVVSNTLEKAEWEPTTIISGDDVNAQLNALKAQPGKDISITGSPTLVRTLLRDGVLDELRLLVHPIVVGKGERLFDGSAESTGLKLLSSRTIANDVLYLVYAPAPIPENEDE
ncbi:dihydrofolate reductase family protein [Sphaerisporangium sp. TRM90804]|uniref:dihydrofolate reductase family protein n=1 Tax=Sphaerisporangium sp. TRM90804 TaxID=3031113 RepID=UPI00244B6ECA|nr:dihydrofolate reductase family protein [Sphaerisporangium sp. TRM90804]MDH2430894.1 dihydrofolate reductase family protein [Sphaerisporangium sp. TRM90804]